LSHINISNSSSSSSISNKRTTIAEAAAYYEHMMDTSSTVAADEQKLPPIVVESAQLAQAILPDTFKGDASHTKLKAFKSSLSSLNTKLEKFGMQGQILTNNGPLKQHKAITNSKMANHCTFDYKNRSKFCVLYCKCCKNQM
jgi:hypothetical protein